MDPSSLALRLAALQQKLSVTTCNEKRFKIGLKIDKCKALLDAWKATAAAVTAAAANTNNASPRSPSLAPARPFSSIAPLRLTPAELAKRSERASRFEKEHQQSNGGGGGGGGGEKLTLREARLRASERERERRPLSAGAAARKKAAAPPPPAPVAAAVGANTSLEKPYLRLTSLPAVEDVRPPRVLAAALARLVEKWEVEVELGDGDGDDSNNNGTLSSPPASSSASSARLRRRRRRSLCYDSYFREQLKSIRQDAVVQGVRGALAVECYEAHARVALRSGDLAEFNQCQTALLGDLYRDFERGGGGDEEGEEEERRREKKRKKKKKKKKRKTIDDGDDDALLLSPPASSPSPASPSPSPSLLHPCLRHRPEFAAYRILYAQAMALSSAERRARERNEGGAAASASASAAPAASSAVPAALQGVRPEDRDHRFVLRALRCASLAREGRARELAEELEGGGGPREIGSFAPLLLPRARAVAARSLVAAWRGGAGGSAGKVSIPLSDAARLLGCRQDDDEDLSAAIEAFRGAGAAVDVAAGVVSILSSSSSSSSSSKAQRNSSSTTSATPALLSVWKAKKKVREKAKKKRKKRRESSSSSSDDDDSDGGGEDEKRAWRKQSDKKKKRKK